MFAPEAERLKETPSNKQVADKLDRVAELLEQNGANAFRVLSYRRAAQSIRDAETPLQQVVEARGEEGLRELPGVGQKLAGAIRQLVETGHLGLLDELEKSVSPVDVLTRVPGIGKRLASRIHSALGIESLEDLEVAAHDGRLEQVEGIGEKMLPGIRDALAGMLSRSARRRARQRVGGREELRQDRPPVALLLEIDAEYRRRAEGGELHTIAPKRFNPRHESWLPIMHAQRNGWEFTVLFSNTARAHELGKTHDWVVIYYARDGEQRQNTVVTATSGPLRDMRVVRGREAECRLHYQQ